MMVSETGISFIKSWEAFRGKAYQDSKGVWTIGYGTIKYPDGIPVRMGDTCTEEHAEVYLADAVQNAVDTINKLKWAVPLTQHQFDALVSFHYNTGNLPNSTLYHKASINPNDETIYKYNKDNIVNSCEFLRWVKVMVNGKLIVIDGLINRRKAEADLYWHN